MKVKDYLAGRKGICPTCGARFRIPPSAAVPPGGSVPPVVVATQPASRPSSDAAGSLPLAAGRGIAPLAAVVSLDASSAAGLPDLLMLVDSVDAGGLDGPPSAAVQVDPDPTADLEVDEEDDASAALAWYIAIPGGEPSAALCEPELLAWLDSGRATGREVVWRSDWPGWRPIAEAFPDRCSPPFRDPDRR
jgi:hypothetical protein